MSAPETTYAAGPAHAAHAHIGEAVPEVDLRDASGAQTTLQTATRGRAAVIVFYRGAWCPFCNIALRAYEAALAPALAAHDVTLLAVSPQLPDGSRDMAEKNELSFTVLSDPGNTLARHWGLLAPQSAERTAARLEKGLDLTARNADGTTDLVHPTVAVLDAAGVLRWIDVHEDHRVRSAPDDILAAVDALP